MDDANLWQILLRYASQNPLVGGGAGFLALALIFGGLWRLFRPELQTVRADRITAATIESQTAELKNIRDRLSASEKAFEEWKDRALSMRQEFGETIINLKTEMASCNRQLIDIRAENERLRSERDALVQDLSATKAELSATKAELYLYEAQSRSQAEQIALLDREVQKLTKAAAKGYGRRRDDTEQARTRLADDAEKARALLAQEAAAAAIAVNATVTTLRGSPENPVHVAIDRSDEDKHSDDDKK